MDYQTALAYCDTYQRIRRSSRIQATKGSLMPDAVIVDAVRTASGKGKPGGALSGTHPVELLANVLAALVARTGVDPARIDDVITGCVAQVGEQSLNIGRQGVLAAGWPVTV